MMEMLMLPESGGLPSCSRTRRVDVYVSPLSELETIQEPQLTAVSSLIAIESPIRRNILTSAWYRDQAGRTRLVGRYLRPSPAPPTYRTGCTITGRFNANHWSSSIPEKRSGSPAKPFSVGPLGRVDTLWRVASPAASTMAPLIPQPAARTHPINPDIVPPPFDPSD